MADDPANDVILLCLIQNYPDLSADAARPSAWRRSLAASQALAKFVRRTYQELSCDDGLINGAGIAGPALAHWLSRTGYRVVVVETAPGISRQADKSTCGARADVTAQIGLLEAVT